MSNNEDSPLLLGQPGRKSNRHATFSAQGLKKHFIADVTKNWADLVLLYCYIIVGLLDSSAVFIWGSFVSMQTGNTVYLGLGLIAPHEGIRWIKAATSIASFCLGSFAFARFHRYFSPARRWVLLASYALQTGMIALAASIVTWWEGVGRRDATTLTTTTTMTTTSHALHWPELVALAAVAFQSSGQAVTSRALKYNGLTSVVLTTNYCDLFSDPDLFQLTLAHAERNRRIAAPLLVLLGACLGGLYAHSSVGLSGALWTAAVMKSFAVMAWVFWKSEAEHE